jgi:choline dehydrogenase-like flavoprotein
MLTPQERRLRIYLKILALLFGLAIFAYLLPALFGPLQSFYINLPFVTNSVVKIGGLALLAFFAAADVRRFRLLTVLVIWGHVISELATAAVLIWGKTDYAVDIAGNIVPIRRLLWGSMALDGIILVLLVWFYVAAERARYALGYFSPGQFRTLTALAEVVVMGENEAITAEEAARNVDHYLTGFRARAKWITKLVLTGVEIYPLLTLKPPFSYMRAEDRGRFIRKRFYRDVQRRLIPLFWRTLVQGTIRMGKQLSYLGYYNDPRTFASVGYVPFSKRPDFADRIAKSPIEERPPLHVYTAADIKSDALTGDVVIVGSGAAGAALAHGLAEAGRDVLILERGDYVEPSQYTENEVDMLSKLYADGALQLSRDFRFQVLQGSCVGGTTVVNNAVCFDLPPEVLDRWNAPDMLDGGINVDKLWASFRRVRQLVGVERQAHGNLNRSGVYFLDGLKRLGFDQPPHRRGEVEANIHGCLGCGYCNIGCRYGKKLSMLDTVLPMTQQKFNKNGREALRIVAGCEAMKIQRSGKRIRAITCRFRDGRKLTVQGKTFVIAAGAVSSSILLLRSGIGGKRVGKNLSFNMGSPMSAVFDNIVNAYDGLQISHYLEPIPHRGFIIETWYNPPVAQALSMPGWFDDHFTNMRRYNRIASVGVLVGTESNAEVRQGLLTPRDIKYTPTRNDLNKLLEGLVLAGEIFLAAGAKCVLPHTFKYYEFADKAELQRLPNLVRDASDLTLGTGHPQGGNILSRSPESGVVDPEFRVHGYENLFLCDASVFPTSVKVNPQLTVMALADYAAPLIAQAD